MFMHRASRTGRPWLKALFMAASAVTVSGCTSKDQAGAVDAAGVDSAIDVGDSGTDAAVNGDALSGPAACAAAGGQCLLGGAPNCVIVGPQDCKPDRNPGGAFCCLDKAVVPDAASCTDGGIEASSYDQTCAKDSDCVAIGEGNSCLLCAFNCTNAAISKGALAKYMADIANTPAGISDSSGKCFSGCPAEFGPCCNAGKCAVNSQCQSGVPDAGALGDADASAAADAAADANAE